MRLVSGRATVAAVSSATSRAIRCEVMVSSLRTRSVSYGAEECQRAVESRLAGHPRNGGDTHPGRGLEASGMCAIPLEADMARLRSGHRGQQWKGAGAKERDRKS